MSKLQDLFNRFCESSSIHGINYWHTTLWTFVTLLGIGSAAFMIRNNFISWESNPIIVSVWQVPIEQSPFPGITICPLDDTR
ncbi:Gonad-specific amiloride-sensitive sodium channel 1, partial [Caligus rogercresseyi]